MIKQVTVVIFCVMIQIGFQTVIEDKALCNGRSGDCCAGFRYDSKRNICVECPIGYFGNSCEKSCPYPLFGNACRDKCNCPEYECNNIDGCVQRKSTERTTLMISIDTVRYTTSNKLNSSIQNDTEKNNDNRLSILTTKERIGAPIRNSFIILLCLSTTILLLYLASYGNFVDRLRKCFIYDNAMGVDVLMRIKVDRIYYRDHRCL